MKQIELEDHEMALIFSPEHTKVVSPADEDASHVGILLAYGVASYLTKMMSDRKVLIDFLYAASPELGADFKKFLTEEENNDEEE